MKDQLVIAMIVGTFMLGGISASLYGGNWLLEESNKTQSWFLAQGTVVAHQDKSTQDSNNRTSTIYEVTIKFATTNGKTHQFKQETTNSSYKEGQKVVVTYDPSTPTNALIHSLWSLYGAPLIVLIFGLGASLIPFAVFLGLQGSKLAPAMSLLVFWLTGIGLCFFGGFSTYQRNVLGTPFKDALSKVGVLEGGLLFLGITSMLVSTGVVFSLMKKERKENSSHKINKKKKRKKRKKRKKK